MKQYADKRKRLLGGMSRIVDVYREARCAAGFGITGVRVEFAALWLRHSGKISAASRVCEPTGRSALIIPPALAGSLGDDAMVSATAAELRDMGFSDIGCACRVPKPEFRYSVEDIEEIRFHAFPGDISWADLMSFGRTCIGYDTMWYLGADILDGRYNPRDPVKAWALARLADRLGTETNVVGFSFNRRPAREAKWAVSWFPKRTRVCVRDPDSLERVRRLSRRAIRGTADVAFLLEPDPEGPEARRIIRWISKVKTGKPIVLAVNVVGPSFMATIDHPDPQQVLLGYNWVLRRLCDEVEDLKVIFVAHDLRMRYEESRLCQEMRAALPTQVQERSEVVGIDATPKEIKAICERVDGVLTHRMHVAIAALGSGVPVVCVGYQDKMGGLLKLFGLKDYIVQTEEVSARPDALFGKIREMLFRRRTLSEEVAERLPLVMQMARENFVNVGTAGGRRPARGRSSAAG